ncbi:MAG: membrane fusion protein (multidrug efflux system) [Oceanicoccus sp.]|jgi:membrane fusion protein (multidrug efflux system)
MKFRKWMPVIIGCVVVTALLAGFKVRQIQQAIAMGKAFGEPMEVVEMVVAESSQWQATVSATADVVAIQSLELSNEMGGRVVIVGFAAGETISKGQLLVSFDTSEEQAQLAAAEADAELAKLALERNLKLAKSGVTSEEARDQAQAQNNAAIAEKERLRAIIAKKNLIAPFDAKAGIFELEVGQYLQANTIITRLVGDSKQVWIDFNLPQHQARLVIGDSVTISPLGALKKQMHNLKLNAKIIAKDSRVNPRSGNLRYRALVDNSNSELFPGTVVSVTVALGAPQIVTRLPLTAVRYDAAGPNVYVLVPAEAGAAEAERASKRPVELGPEQNQQIVILNGIETGDRIAANGAFKLRDGVLVKAVAPKPSEPAIESVQSSSLVTESPTETEPAVIESQGS